MFSRVLTLIFALCIVGSVVADPTRPPEGVKIVSGELKSVVSSRPVLEAIFKKGEKYVAIINGTLTTESYDSPSLKVTRISKKDVDVEYKLNGAWSSDTLSLAVVPFSTKSTTKIE